MTTERTFEEQHEHNLRILRLIRDEPAWALSRILRCEQLEAALDHLDLARGASRVEQAQERG